MPRTLLYSVAAVGAVAIAAGSDGYVSGELLLPIGGAKKIRVWNVAVGITNQAAAGNGKLSAVCGDLYIGMATAAGIDLGSFVALPKDESIQLAPLSDNLSVIMVMNSLAPFEIEMQEFGNPVGATQLSIGGEFAVRNSDVAARTAQIALRTALFEFV